MMWPRFCTIVLAAAAAVATVTGTASAQATQGTLYSQETLVFPETDALCTGLTGTITNVVTDSGHFVTTDDTFHFSGFTLQDYRVDFSDGTYVLSSSPSHFEGGGNAEGQFEFTAAQQDRRTLYSPTGDVIGIVSVFTQTHQNWRDTNGNRIPDPGEFTANVSQLRVTCP